MQKKKIMKRRNIILLILFLCLGFTSSLRAADSAEKSGVDVKEIVIGHMSDAYDWHITTIAGHHISIPLPVIVKGETSGWQVFSSSHLTHLHEDELYNGFFVNKEDGKVYEKLSDGTVARPWDLSITKNVAQIWIAVFLLIFIFLKCASWYKKRDASSEAPRGFVGAFEAIVVMIKDDVVKECIGEKRYKPYVPYLLTVFFFILACNLLGVVPIFPGGGNVTGNISVTLVLAVLTLLIVNFSGNKHYWKEVFWPDVPTWLKLPIPLMPVIEIISIFTKPFALMIRLFANMMSGHAVLLSLTCIIFVGFEINAAIGSGLTIVSVLLMIFMNFLEVLIDFVQAYIFTMLSAVFIGMAMPEEEHHKEEKENSALEQTIIETK